MTGKSIAVCAASRAFEIEVGERRERASAAALERAAQKSGGAGFDQFFEPGFFERREFDEGCETERDQLAWRTDECCDRAIAEVR